MTKFLKGDATAAITLALADGFDYSGKTVHLEYQGARRSFSGVAAGGSLTFSFTAAETAPMSLGAYPVRVWMEDENGGITTIKNADVKLCVTDSAADVHSDGAIYLDVRGGLYGLDGLPDRWNENDLKAKIDEIIRRLGGTVAMLLVCALPAFCAGPLTVQTAPKGEVYNDAQIVTNVDFDVSALAAKADATNTYTKAETDAAIVRLAPAPGNYAAVSNAAMNARGKADLAVYRKVGVGETWTLVSSDGAMTNSATGVFVDNGGGWGMWGFYTNGVSVAGSGYGSNGSTLYDYEIPWAGAPGMGNSGTARRPYVLQPTGDHLASTNEVCGIVTNISDNWTGELGTLTKRYNNFWRGHIGAADYVVELTYVAPHWLINDDSVGLDLHETVEGSAGSRRLVFELADGSTAATLLGTNKIVLARECLLSDYPRFEDVDKAISSATNNIPRPDMSNYATTGQVFAVSNIAASAVHEESDPTVSDWAKAESKPTYNAGEVGAYSAADGTNLANVVNLWEGYWDGTNVIFEVTNYYGNTSGELPRLRIKELREGAWHTVWDEANKFAVCETQIVAIVAASNAACRAGCAADLATGLAGRAPLAWGTVTDKGSPNVVSNSVWMTAPETYFAGGTEYQRVAVGSGTICVLVDNGAGTYTTGEEGTFRFQDEGGTNYFGFAKSDSYTIGCRTDGITVSGTLVTLRYDVIMGGTDVPIVYYRQSLTSGEWVQLNNADGTATQGAPYTVTWYTSGGSYYAAINCGENSSGFFKAETSVAGDVVFETNMKARLDGGIECPNTATGVMGVIRPTFNGSTVIWNWSAR